jgi:hypothetical protein
MPLAAGWPQLKRKIDSLTKSPADLFKAAVEAGDVDEVRQLLQSHAELVATQDRQYQGTAVDWLVHGALGPWGFSTGQYGECARLLLGAGAASTRRHCRPAMMASIGCCASTS